MIYFYSDNVDTDVIIPARYLNSSDPEVLKRHAMEDIDKDFAKTVQPGDIILAGQNFGSGSSREHAPLVLKACGISVVIAKSFARIFYRNAINIGLRLIENAEIVDSTSKNDVLSVDFAKNLVTNQTTGGVFQIAETPDFLQNIISAGGLMNTLKK